MKSKDLPKHFESERGATMIEYALLLSLIALVGLAGVPSMSREVEVTFQTMTEALENAGSQSDNCVYVGNQLVCPLPPE